MEPDFTPPVSPIEPVSLDSTPQGVTATTPPPAASSAATSVSSTTPLQPSIVDPAPYQNIAGPAESGRKSSRFVAVIITVTLLAITGALAFWALSNRTSTPPLEIPLSAPVDWGTIDTKVGFLRYPVDGLSNATTARQGNGALILYSTGQVISLMNLQQKTDLSVAENQTFYYQSTQSVNGITWEVQESFVSEIYGENSKQYWAIASTTYDGEIYELSYQRAEEDTLGGGTPLTDEAITEARATFGKLLSGVVFN